MHATEGESAPAAPAAPGPGPGTATQRSRRVASRPWIVLLGVTAAGLAVRLAWWAIAGPAPVSDFLGYRSIAERLVDTGEYTRHGEPSAWRAPGYPGVLAAGMLLSRSDRWLSLLNVGLSTAAIPLTWLLAHRLGLGRRTALAAAAAAAALPTLVLLAPVLASENLQIPLLLGAWALVLGHGSRRRTTIPAGLALGAAALVRPESLAFLLALPALARIPTGRWRPALARTAAVGAVAVVVVLPWYIRNTVVIGPGVGLSSTGGANFYMAHRPHGYGFIEPDQTPLAGLDEAALSRQGYRLGLEAIADHPPRVLRNTVRGTYELLRPPTYAAYYSTRAHGTEGPYPPSVSPAVVSAARRAAVVGWWISGPLAAAGTLGLLVRRRRAAVALLAVAGATWLSFTVLFWAMPRYRLAIEPLIALTAGAAVVMAGEHLVTGVRRARATRGRRGAAGSAVGAGSDAGQP